MIRLKDILKEAKKSKITNELIDDIFKIVTTKYNSVIQINHDDDWRGRFVRVIFTDYMEAIDFYNKGYKLLSKLIKVQQVGDRGPKINGRLFIVSHKIIN